MYRISKDFNFSAAHRLDGLPKDHPCSRVHGHNYVVRLVLEADTVNEIGFVRDYRNLDEFKTWLDAAFDHRDINEVFIGTGINSTAENIAEYIYQVAVIKYPEVVGVGVSETNKTWAYFYPGFTLGSPDPTEDDRPFEEKEAAGHYVR